MPLEKPEVYSAMGIKPPKGVLLYGPPGTGKTLLATALAEELGCHVELVAATELVGSFVGEAETKIRGGLRGRCFESSEFVDLRSLFFSYSW